MNALIREILSGSWQIYEAPISFLKFVCVITHSISRTSESPKGGPGGGCQPGRFTRQRPKVPNCDHVRAPQTQAACAGLTLCLASNEMNGPFSVIIRLTSTPKFVESLVDLVRKNLEGKRFSIIFFSLTVYPVTYRLPHTFTGVKVMVKKDMTVAQQSHTLLYSLHSLSNFANCEVACAAIAQSGAVQVTRGKGTATESITFSVQSSR